jgi:hypothetical protein
MGDKNPKKQLKKKKKTAEKVITPAVTTVEAIQVKKPKK